MSAARFQKLFARFTGADGHVPLMMSLLTQGQEQRALRTDLPPLGLLVGAIALGMAPMLVRRRLGELGSEVPTPEVAASVMSTILFEGIAARPGTDTKPRRRSAPRKPPRPPRRRRSSP